MFRRDIREPGTYVRLGAEHPDLVDRQAAVDALWKFVFTDVPFGRWLLVLRNDKKELGMEAWVRSHPANGSDKRAAHQERPVENPPVKTPSKPSSEKDKKELVLAGGTVRDVKGVPVEGVDVYALVTPLHAGSLSGWSKSTRTDSAGRWKIEKEDGLRTFIGRLLVHKEGHPYSVTPLGEQGEQHYDLVLPSRGGVLEVKILRDGKPVPKAAVRIDRVSGPPQYGGMPAGQDQPNRDKVESLLSPAATADDKGVARFRHLFPGTYSIVAYDADKTDVRANCNRVAVRDGETTQFEASIYPQHSTLFVGVRVLNANGKPPAGREAGIKYGRVEGASTTHSTLALDDSGADKIATDGPGLWNVQVGFSEPSGNPLASSPTSWFETTAVVAASPLLEKSTPIVLTATEHHLEQGSVTIQLQDAAGKPVRGFVQIDVSFGDEAAFAGSTDAKGKIIFSNVETGKHTLQALLPRNPLPDLRQDGEPLPPDKDLVGHTVFFRDKFIVTDCVESKVVARPRPVGYVRGILRPAKSRTCADYVIQWPSTEVVSEATVKYNNQTGEWILGPLPEGKVTVVVWCRKEGKEGVVSAICLEQEVTVHSDRVTRIDLSPPAEVDWAAGQLLAENTLAGPARTQGRIAPMHRSTSADGKTPAWGARLALFVPECWQGDGQRGDGRPGRWLPPGWVYDARKSSGTAAR